MPEPFKPILFIFIEASTVERNLIVRISHFLINCEIFYNKVMIGYNQSSMMQMNMMTGGMGMMMGGMPLMNSANRFVFIGNPISLQSRLQSAADEQYQGYREATITVTGTQLNPLNIGLLILTSLCGGFFILPLFCFCMNCWKRRAYATYTVPVTTYLAMDRLFAAPNISNITLTVIDNTFDQ